MQDQICVQADISTANNDPTNGRVVPNSTPNNDSPDMGEENNAPSNNTPNNTTPNATPNNTVGPTNNTPDACNPACEAPQTCVDGSCVFPDCAAVGDPCDPSRPAQGLFTCLDVDGQGVCAQPCGRAPSVDSCPSGQYCLSYDGRNVCLPSFCDTNADCTNGTCVHVDNEFRFCFPAGDLPPDAANCDPDNDQCGVGQACDPGTRFCEPLCDPWAASPCANNHFCGVPITPRTAICSHNIDGAAPLDPFYQCMDTGAMCADAVECLAFGTVSACVKYCRPSMNDCAGVLDGNDTQTVCNGYALFQPGLGLCFTPCDASDPDPCGPGLVCDNQLCRIPCSPGNEVADCCDGQSPCPAWCNPATNLCE